MEKIKVNNDICFNVRDPSLKAPYFTLPAQYHPSLIDWVKSLRAQR